MKTRWLSILGLGLAIICLGLATQSPAAKGGIPGAPGGEDPPPEPMPVSYTFVDVQIANTSYFNAHSINDYGVLAGSYQYGEENSLQAYNLAPEIVDDSVIYIDSNLITLANEVIDLVVFHYQGRISVNNSGQTSGVRYTNSGMRAVLWLEGENGIDEIDLGVAPGEIETTSHDINDAGRILVRNADSLTSYVLVPEDADGDGQTDTWFKDDDEDGINDLMYPLTAVLTPVKINEVGQILFREGVLLTPDFEDPDGDGNPWFADDGNKGNGLLFPLSPLVEGAGLTANDMNDLGKIVGISDDRAVMWEVVIDAEAITETITELPELSRHSSGLNAMGINNSNQIVGTCWEKKTATAFLIQDQEVYNLEDLLIDDVDISRSFGRYLWAINNEGWIINIWGDVLVPVVQP